MKKIVIQGLGFVGSATALAVASKLDKNKKPLFSVCGVDLENDIGKERISKINNGIFPFPSEDKNISREMKKCHKNKNLFATYSDENYSDADVIIISINCDLGINGKNIMLKKFIKSCEVVAKKITSKTLVIVQSTVPPGTCEKIIYPIFRENLIKRKIKLKEFWLAHSYERVMPGRDYLNSITNYWRVYSGINTISADKCKNFLNKIINTKKFPLSRLESTTASEISKVLENSYRAVNIAFIEEWSRFAEEVKVDLFEVIETIRKRPTHANIRQPGFGVGGYCLTKDPLFAKIASKQLFKLKNHNFTFSTAAIHINNSMPLVSLNKIKNYFNGSIKKKKILIMGITYRDGIADTRFSPSEIFYDEARKNKAEVFAHDPLVKYWEQKNIKTESNLSNLEDFDVVLFAVQHPEYTKIKFNKIFKSKKNILIFDSNKVLSLKQINDIKKVKSLKYQSIGRG